MAIGRRSNAKGALLAKLLPGRRAPGIPSADVPRLQHAARRTTLVRGALAVSLLVVLLASVNAARDLEEQPGGLVPRGSSAVLVLDFSRSVASESYLRIGSVLRALVAAQEPAGLVAFSDSAYELLPPGTPASELRRFLRFFTTDGASARASPATAGFPANPWPETFRGGTRISAGLELARAILRRDGIEAASVVLVSDLAAPSSDLPRLSDALVAFRGDEIRLRIVPVAARPEHRAFFARLAGRGAFVDPSELARMSRPRREGALEGTTPEALLALGFLLVVLLAVNEHLCGRLALPWTRRQTVSGG